jgi:hypothetical protein
MIKNSTNIVEVTWELISAYTVCDFDKNVLVLLHN